MFKKVCTKTVTWKTKCPLVAIIKVRDAPFIPIEAAISVPSHAVLNSKTYFLSHFCLALNTLYMARHELAFCAVNWSPASDSINRAKLKSLTMVNNYSMKEKWLLEVMERCHYRYQPPFHSNVWGYHEYSNPTVICNELFSPNHLKLIALLHMECSFSLLQVNNVY